MRGALALLLLAACARETGHGANPPGPDLASDSPAPDMPAFPRRDGAADVAADPAPDTTADSPPDAATDTAPDRPDPPPDLGGDLASSCNGLSACACEIALCQRVTFGCSCPSDFCAECGTGCDIDCICGGGPYLGCAPTGCPAVLGCPPGCEFVAPDGCLECTPGCI